VGSIPFPSCSLLEPYLGDATGDVIVADVTSRRRLLLLLLVVAGSLPW